jgi:hypothetical protein
MLLKMLSRKPPPPMLLPSMLNNGPVMDFCTAMRVMSATMELARIAQALQAFATRGDEIHNRVLGRLHAFGEGFSTADAASSACSR